MSISAFFKKRIILPVLAALVLTACGQAHENTENITICDFSGFSTNATDEDGQMDDLYLYIVENSTVITADADEVEKMAESIYASYEKVVSISLSEYNEKGHTATFEEMLKFLFNLDSREALTAFSEAYAGNEVKNRMVIREIAAEYSLQISDEEYASLSATVEVGDYMAGSIESEVRYELLRRKVLRCLLDEMNK